MTKRVYEVIVEEYEYEVDGQKLMGVLALPASGSNFPVIIDIHGHVIGSEHAISIFNPAMGRPYTRDIQNFTKNGFAVFLPVMVGYGRTGGKMDFCGPKTIAGVIGGVEQIVLNDKRIDKSEIFIYGVSRGASVAASIATQFPQYFTAAVFQSGVYDARNGYNKTKIEGIKENFRREAGTTDKSFRERSPILDMEKLKCPVLILHGDKDDRVDVSEAINLDSKLNELEKEHKTVILQGRDHFLVRSDVDGEILDFLNIHLNKP